MPPRLLELQEQRILTVPAEHQRDPRPRANAADADYLAREVGQLELLQQDASIELQRVAVAAQQLV